MQKHQQAIIEGNIPKTIVRLTLPSIVGMLGIMIFNVVDTFYVGRLGAIELAAISFTFPVVMVINSLTLGIGVAAMSLFSKAAGNKDREAERLLATSALMLGLLFAAGFSSVGLSTIRPLFSLLGAGDELLPYISDYMGIWFIGCVFIVIPMIGDHILRGLGDTKTPSFVMMTSALVNMILDPLLIFGLGPFPRMGVRGAALATVIARMMTCIVSILIQTRREHLITFKGLTFRKVLGEWERLLFLGIPNAIVKAIPPVGAAVFTSILAGFGYEVVAGFGVAVKIEGLIFSVINALSITAAIFTGLNFGAKRFDRVRAGFRWVYIYGIMIGSIAAILLLFTGRSIGSLFNADPLVVQTTARYLAIVPAGYAFYSFGQTGTSILNVYHRPGLVSLQNFVQIGIVAVPLAYLLSSLWQETGLFIAIAISYLVMGSLSLILVRRQSVKMLQGS